MWPIRARFLSQLLWASPLRSSFKHRDFPHLFTFLWNLSAARSSFPGQFINSSGRTFSTLLPWRSWEKPPVQMSDPVEDAPLARGSVAGSEEALVLPVASRGWDESQHLSNINFILIKLNSLQHVIFVNKVRLFLYIGTRNINLD